MPCDIGRGIGGGSSNSTTRHLRPCRPQTGFDSHSTRNVPLSDKSWVRLYRTGYQRTPIHGCDPTTAQHGDFCLLGFPPGPVRPSLDNLETPSSHGVTILMPSLVRTPDRHGTPESRTPALKPSTNSSLQVARLQEHATTPSESSG
ncbi:proteasome endopeptidase complex [Plakobranchus ocellatus]|uniref:Proteasome endopeptidase complex n=1 Tax=Plakobranchus ocellatus TaxID=259542 RepID=A0AAV3ZAJ3_9GAST|nr:proteasome endopeptidase complex [Plakobranchus ocellatus]